MASDPTVKDERLWHDKYTLRKSMVPSFLTMELAKKVRIAPYMLAITHLITT